jgi:alkylation response protein AidB-like acyl-CoA dehydrogenase
MDFSLSEDQRIFLKSVRGFLEKEAKGLYRQCEKTELGYSRDFWKKMGELGWMGLILPEEFGGSGGTILDMTILLEEMGRALVTGPFIPTMLCGHSILKFAEDEKKKEFLPGIASGDITMVPAFIRPEKGGLYEKNEEIVDEDNGYFILKGLRILVPYGNSSDFLLYKTDRDGEILVFIVDSKSQGLTARPLKTISGFGNGEVVLDRVRVPEANLVGRGEKGQEVVRWMEELGALMHSAYILGILGKVLEMTIAHAKERIQFDRPIGSFQAIQHQLADMMTEIEKLRYLTYQAGWKIDEGIDAKMDISMAKAKASNASRNITLMGIKIHGGIGISEEHDLGLYFRMAKSQEIAFGDGDFHNEIIARQLGL